MYININWQENLLEKHKKLKENSTLFSSLNVLWRKKNRGQKQYGQKENRLAKEQQNEKVHCFLDFFRNSSLTTGQTKAIIKKKYALLYM